MNSLPHNGTLTSMIAAEAKEPSAFNDRAKILEHLVELEPNGSTADATDQWLGLGHQTNSPRFGELSEDGLIYDTGELQPTRSGFPAVVHRPTEVALYLIRNGWYRGDRINPQRKISRIAEMRAALYEALQGWASNTTDPLQLARIAKLEPLTKSSPRRRAK